MIQVLQRLTIDIFETSASVMRDLLALVLGPGPEIYRDAQHVFAGAAAGAEASAKSAESAAEVVRVFEGDELKRAQLDTLHFFLNFAESNLKMQSETAEVIRRCLTKTAPGMSLRAGMEEFLSRVQVDQFFVDAQTALGNTERSVALMERLREIIEDELDERNAEEALAEAERTNEWVDHAELRKRLSLSS